MPRAVQQNGLGAEDVSETFGFSRMTAGDSFRRTCLLGAKFAGEVASGGLGFLGPLPIHASVPSRLGVNWTK